MAAMLAAALRPPAVLSLTLCEPPAFQLAPGSAEAQQMARDDELGALLVAGGLGPPAEHELISLLALNGLRVSEATGADIQALGVERVHRTLVVIFGVRPTG